MWLASKKNYCSLLILENYNKYNTIVDELEFQLGPTPDLSVSYFWHAVESGNENEFNEQMMQEIHNDGEVFLSSTILNEKFVIRIAILSFRTKLHTVDKAIDMIVRARKKVLENWQ